MFLSQNLMLKKNFEKLCEILIHFSNENQKQSIRDLRFSFKFYEEARDLEIILENCFCCLEEGKIEEINKYLIKMVQQKSNKSDSISLNPNQKDFLLNSFFQIDSHFKNLEFENKSVVFNLRKLLYQFLDLFTGNQSYSDGWINILHLTRLEFNGMEQLFQLIKIKNPVDLIKTFNGKYQFLNSISNLINRTQSKKVFELAFNKAHRLKDLKLPLYIKILIGSPNSKFSSILLPDVEEFLKSKFNKEKDFHIFFEHLKSQEIETLFCKYESVLQILQHKSMNYLRFLNVFQERIKDFTKIIIYKKVFKSLFEDKNIENTKEIILCEMMNKMSQDQIEEYFKNLSQINLEGSCNLFLQTVDNFLKNTKLELNPQIYLKSTFIHFFKENEVKSKTLEKLVSRLKPFLEKLKPGKTALNWFKIINKIYQSIPNLKHYKIVNKTLGNSLIEFSDLPFINNTANWKKIVKLNMWESFTQKFLKFALQKFNDNIENTKLNDLHYLDAKFSNPQIKICFEKTEFQHLRQNLFELLQQTHPIKKIEDNEKKRYLESLAFILKIQYSVLGREMKTILFQQILSNQNSRKEIYFRILNQSALKENLKPIFTKIMKSDFNLNEFVILEQCEIDCFLRKLFELEWLNDEIKKQEYHLNNTRTARSMRIIEKGGWKSKSYRIINGILLQMKKRKNLIFEFSKIKPKIFIRPLSLILEKTFFQSHQDQIKRLFLHRFSNREPAILLNISNFKTLKNNSKVLNYFFFNKIFYVALWLHGFKNFVKEILKESSSEFKKLKKFFKSLELCEMSFSNKNISELTMLKLINILNETKIFFKKLSKNHFNQSVHSSLAKELSIFRNTGKTSSKLDKIVLNNHFFGFLLFNYEINQIYQKQNFSVLISVKRVKSFQFKIMRAKHLKRILYNESLLKELFGMRLPQKFFETLKIHLENISSVKSSTLEIFRENENFLLNLKQIDPEKALILINLNSESQQFEDILKEIKSKNRIIEIKRLKKKAKKDILKNLDLHIEDYAQTKLGNIDLKKENEILKNNIKKLHKIPEKNEKLKRQLKILRNKLKTANSDLFKVSSLKFLDKESQNVVNEKILDVVWQEKQIKNMNSSSNALYETLFKINRPSYEEKKTISEQVFKKLSKRIAEKEKIQILKKKEREIHKIPKIENYEYRKKEYFPKTFEMKIEKLKKRILPIPSIPKKIDRILFSPKKRKSKIEENQNLNRKGFLKIIFDEK